MIRPGVSTVAISIGLSTSVLLCMPAHSQRALRQGAAQVQRNTLPPVRMDSFVHEAGRFAETIYGDESIRGVPPYKGFTPVHRINNGILDTRDRGLTTGHGSELPDATGRDEFLGLEMSQSGEKAAGADGLIQLSDLYLREIILCDPNELKK